MNTNSLFRFSDCLEALDLQFEWTSHEGCCARLQGVPPVVPCGAEAKAGPEAMTSLGKGQVVLRRLGLAWLARDRWEA